MMRHAHAAGPIRAPERGHGRAARTRTTIPATQSAQADFTLSQPRFPIARGEPVDGQDPAIMHPGSGPTRFHRSTTIHPIRPHQPHRPDPPSPLTE